MAASLVGRSSIHQTLTVHRLVQVGVFDRLTQEEKNCFLSCAVSMLSSSFPNTWNQGGPDQDRNWESWETCSEVLSHVSWLLDLLKMHELPVKEPEHLAVLIFRTGS